MKINCGQRVFACALAMLLFLAACAPAAPAATSAPSASIQDIVWQWTSVQDKATGKTDPVPNPQSYTVTFKADGSLYGKADCNNFTGTYSQQNGFTIKLGATTLAACGPASLDQQYLQLLGSVAAGGPDGAGGLALETAGGAQRMSFKNGGTASAAGGGDLAGTSWETIGYNNGKQAVTSVMAGTTLTADFGKDGILSGNSGCNTYSGPYKVDGSKITIGPLSATRMACGEPAGVMEQETQYLAALQSATIYRIEGSVLELRTGDGALAANFDKK